MFRLGGVVLVKRPESAGPIKNSHMNDTPTVDDEEEQICRYFVF